MSTLGIIDTHVTNVLKATTADEKLDEIARAVGESRTILQQHGG